MKVIIALLSTFLYLHLGSMEVSLDEKCIRTISATRYVIEMNRKQNPTTEYFMTWGNTDSGERDWVEFTIGKMVITPEMKNGKRAEWFNKTDIGICRICYSDKHPYYRKGIVGMRNEMEYRAIGFVIFDEKVTLEQVYTGKRNIEINTLIQNIKKVAENKGEWDDEFKGIYKQIKEEYYKIKK